MGDMSLPQKMKWAFKELDNIRKENYSWVPSSGQGTYNAGQKIYIDLPLNSLVDLSTFQMAYEGATTHAGAPNGAAANDVRTRFFPRNTASIIQNLEVKINNISIFNVPDYNLVWNKLYDYTQSQDGLNRRRIGENADPSCKSFKYNHANGNAYTVARRGYSHGSTDDNSAYDKDNYVIKTWLGPFASASTQIIDTTLLGTVSIIITLAPSTILMLGIDAPAREGAATTPDCLGGALQVAQRAANGGAVAAEAINYTLTNVNLTIDRYHMPEAFYQAQASLLSSGSIYKLWFPNYAVLTGNTVQAVNKAGTHRFSISTRSLDWVIGTFKLPNYDTVSAPLMTYLAVANNANIYFGNSGTTFDNQLKNGMPLLFNNTRYLATNGTSITSTKWKIGTHEYRTKTPQETFDALCNHYNIQNDMSGGMFPGIASLHHFTDTFYGDLISLNVSGESNDIFSVSGVNASQGPINIEWVVNSTATPIDGTLIQNAADTCIPYLIAGYSSHINIRGGRQIELVS